jgi:regulator of sigma E protease
LDTHDVNHAADSRYQASPEAPSNAASPPPPVEGEPATAAEWFRQNGTILFMIALLIGWVFTNWGLEGLRNSGLAALGLGFVIFIHELGHFATAKWCDVHVETFSIGFGPPLPGCKFVRGETTYMIALFPLGGYVKMVGEGAEGDEEDTDPRSFKNKKVWQRLIIISAGVFMNVVLGIGCFIFVFMTRGMERPPAIVGRVDTGSAAYRTGIQSGEEFYKIGSDSGKLYFDDLTQHVVLSKAGEKIDITYGFPGQPRVDTQIEPRKTGGRPVIGVGYPMSLKFPPAKMEEGYLTPVEAQSAAAKAEPGFQFGDQIIGCTDPNAKDHAVTLLPPTSTDDKEPSNLEFRRRSVELVGQPMTIRVRHADKTESEVLVPPAYHYTLGLRMHMGHITALRDGSPAVKAGIQVRGQSIADDQKADGDLILQVRAVDALGRQLLWLRAATSDPALPKTATATPFHDMTTQRQQDRLRNEALLLLAPGNELGWAARSNVVERDLDPLRLPDELRQWAAECRRLGVQTPLKVHLTVQRTQEHKQVSKDIEAEWDDAYRFDDEVPLGSTSPVSIAGLGLAYEVESTIEGVVPGSPAAKAGVREKDVIKQACVWISGKTKADPPHPAETRKAKSFFTKTKDWTEVKKTAWPTHMWSFQNQRDYKKIDLQLERGDEIKEVTLEGVEDPAWPAVNRGYKLMNAVQLQKAKDFGQAVEMGLGKAFSFIGMIYRQISSLATGDLSATQMSGPIGIFGYAYSAADDIFTLVLFLGIISVNLAVVNFMPIPILDGGHAVFLIYEGLRGKPASEQVRMAANWVGLGLIGSLMLFVIFLDLSKWW